MSDDIYKDMILKIQYYKEEVIKSFIKRGHFPLEEEIQAKLDDIDYRTSLFKTYVSKAGSYFNTKEMNNMFELIYKDFEFLYNVLKDILINDYNDLKLYIETHMNELENKASVFEQRFNEEMNSTTFGKTILFRAANWNISTKDEYTIVDLGDMDLIQGSEIALFANLDNIDAETVSFQLTTNDSKLNFNALPYNYNNNTYTVPGTSTVVTTQLKLNGHAIINDNVLINYNVDSKNDYKILGGHNYMIITYKDTNEEAIVDFAYPKRTFYTSQPCYIEFYYVDGTLIEYNFNKKPNHCNFSLSDGYIKPDKNIKKIFIDAPSGFSCNFSVDKGSIWASCTDGIINSPTTLLYSGNWNLKDFQIREYIKTNTTKYNIKLYIKSTKDIKTLIKNVYIKEIE